MDDIPYDYREFAVAVEPIFGFQFLDHKHSEGEFYDEDGHFGLIEGCAGNVVHKAVAGVVYEGDKLPYYLQEKLVELDIEEEIDDDGAIDINLELEIGEETPSE